MTLADHIYNITLGLVMLWGLGSVIYTIPKVMNWWKPLYWLAIPLAALPVVLVFLVEFTSIRGAAILTMLKTVLFLLGVQLIAVPWMHRHEARLIYRVGETEDAE